MSASSSDGLSRARVFALMGKLAPLIFLLILVIIFASLQPRFLMPLNLFNILRQVSIYGIIAVGMTFVILTRGIDLSVGSLVAMSGLCAAVVAHGGIEGRFALSADGTGFHWAFAALAAILAGTLAGLLQGLVVARLSVPAFVVTLGVMAIGRSLAYILSGQTAISNIPEAMQAIVYTNILGIPSNVLFLVVLYIVAWAYLTYTKGGRTIYAVGSNKEAARAAGLNTLFYSVVPYVLSGALSAVAVTFSISQLLSADPLMGNSMELDAIATVVIGGASLYGGRGSMIGTLFGVFIMVMIRNGLNLMGVSPFWQGSAIGTIIILALLVERLVSSRANR